MTTLAANAPASPRRRRRNLRRTLQVGYFSLSGFLIFAALSIGQQPAMTPPARPVTPQPVGAAVVAPNAASPLDEPLRLIGEARKVFADVKDYSCVLVKKERINGQMTPDSVISLKVRQQPFSVYMHWLEPKDLAGQEVCYIAPKHGNRMRVHPNGGLSIFGWVTIEQNDPRALKTSRHGISEAGIGNLIERYTTSWEAERRLGTTKVNVSDFEYNKRRCTRVEAIEPANARGRFDYYRTVVYFDKELKLPIRVECYDFPRDANDPGALVEVFNYLNLRFNTGLGEETFNH